MRLLGWIVALIAMGTAVFFWRQSEDLKSRLAGLSAVAAQRSTDLTRLAEIDSKLDGMDRAFSRGLNAQDRLTRDFAALETLPAQAELRAGIEKRLAALKTDMEGAAATVRALLVAIDPPPFKLDPALVTDEANAAFLASIDADPAYTKLPSGLRYRIVKPIASGPQPTPADEVTVHYRGTFIDGTEFDSSYARNEPATFPLGALIQGWVEGIPLMKQGETARLILPYDLAYGAAGRSSIPPRQTLVFDIELLKIVPAKSP